VSISQSPQQQDATPPLHTTSTPTLTPGGGGKRARLQAQQQQQQQQQSQQGPGSGSKNGGVTPESNGSHVQGGQGASFTH